MTLGAIQTVGPVTFDYQWWSLRYPTLAEWVDPGAGQSYFDIASLYCDNSDGAQPIPITLMENGLWGWTGQRATGSPIRSIPQRQILLGMLTAHVAALNAPLNGQPSPTLIGRISSASEGSVSVSVVYPDIAGAEWYTQTKYGAAFWEATKQYRIGRYFPGPGAYKNNSFYNFGRGRGF